MLAAVDDQLQARPPPAMPLVRQAIQPLAATQTAHDQVDVDFPPLARLGQGGAQARLQFAPGREQAEGGRGFGPVAPHDRFGWNGPAFRAGFLGNDGLVAFEAPERNFDQRADIDLVFRWTDKDRIERNTHLRCHRYRT
ncbi:MAG: hypothetical protein MUE63_14910, partial [Xanthomonadales bacterium]|nr:hypothetical protein [Xanthomonadales bacterium]